MSGKSEFASPDAGARFLGRGVYLASKLCESGVACLANRSLPAQMLALDLKDTKLLLLFEVQNGCVRYCKCDSYIAILNSKIPASLAKAQLTGEANSDFLT